jgi:predicted house-cleaning noncanonical NTP pyrophosphatase (MazG superfamily)
MPQRSKIITLPEDVLGELNQKLLEGKFCDYSALAEWLQSQGFDISRSSLHRYGQNFEERLAAITMATEQARAVADAAKDDDNNMNEALIRLVQTKAFEALTDAKNFESLPKMGVMIAKLSKASVDQKKWMAEMRTKTKAAADDVAKVVRAGGMSESTAKEIRQRILGIV